MNIRQLTSPPAEPLTLAEAMGHVSIGSEITSVQSSYLTTLIQVAREYAEHVTGRVFVKRQFEFSMDGWNDRGDRFGYGAMQLKDALGGAYTYNGQSITLPYAPLISIDYIQYIDMSGQLQMLDPSLYQVDTAAVPGRVKPAYLQIWPVVRATDFNSVRIGFTAGYPELAGASPSDYAYNIPAVIKQWMKIRIGQWFENREAIVVGMAVNTIPRDFVDALLDPLKVWNDWG